MIIYEDDHWIHRKLTYITTYFGMGYGPLFRQGTANFLRKRPQRKEWYNYMYMKNRDQYCFGRKIPDITRAHTTKRVLLKQKLSLKSCDIHFFSLWPVRLVNFFFVITVLSDSS